ncbi:TrbC/VirB2 family protein [Sphingosinicella sp. BN140058]|uniref:TrbC/VirB2 family protein n=1 Tax=Sphingosinicella sp. BN140058 TaxID=1892855 RepID=UPI00197E89C6|nr:TrbC/VirB2 family protein [Sphingosinicella sp. BN140058]
MIPLDSVTQPSALTSAVSWFEGLLLGSVATAVATIAVAAIGFMLLTGRIHYRDAGRVVIGCFILFGAPTIVAGIHAASAQLGRGSGNAPEPRFVTAPVSAPMPAPLPTQPRGNYDPFAGASAPTNYGTCCD